MYLVDTNVLSEVRKGPRCHPNVANWAASTPAGQMSISALVLGEIRLGIERVRPRDPVQARTYESWLDQLHRDFAPRILTVDRDVADVWGRISARRAYPAVDALLAATAVVHDLVLVTRNTRDVHDTGVRVFDPFAA